MNAKPLDLIALQAICADIGETLRQEAIASNTLMHDWSDDRGVIAIDPVTGLEVLPGDGMASARPSLPSKLSRHVRDWSASVVSVTQQRETSLEVTSPRGGEGKMRAPASNE
jgi:hypothetical protein